MDDLVGYNFVNGYQATSKMDGLCRL